MWAVNHKYCLTLCFQIFLMSNCVVSSNTKLLHFFNFLLLNLLLSFLSPRHCSFSASFFFFLPFFTSIAFSFFLSSFFISSHWCFCGFYCTFLWVYLFLNQWVLFGLMQRRERRRPDFCSWVVCLCGGWVVWFRFLRVGIDGFGLTVVVGGKVALALALALALSPAKCSSFG